MSKVLCTIVETSIFTRLVLREMDPDDYRALQLELARSPELGTLIPEAGGLRKVRWRAEGRGKRGGVRLIYFWAPKRQILTMLYLYAKNERTDLTRQQLKMLAGVVKEEFK